MYMEAHLSLHDLNKEIQKALAENLEASYWIVAEIAELRVNQNGHCYLELVEKLDDKIIAKSRATIWSYTYRNLSLWFEKMTNQTLRSGIKILCNVQVQYHEVYGFSLNIKDIDASYTLGERERLRKEVIERLLSDGVFDLNKGLSLCSVITRVAIISSPTAAGFEDFMNQLEQNPYAYTYGVRLYKATMQGDQAVESIINALHAIHNSPETYDAVIIIRGGGSRLDLDCFDHYELNFHASQFPLPLITGIGHERDESILDMVAHQSLKTPTAVAEWLINRTAAYESRLLEKLEEVVKAGELVLRHKAATLENWQYRLSSAATSRLHRGDRQLSQLSGRLKSACRERHIRQENRLSLLASQIEYLDPKSVLRRGYTLTLKDGKPIDTENIKEGDIIETRTLSSVLQSSVVEKRDWNEEI